MKHFSISGLIACFLLSISLSYAQTEKIALDHSVYESWNNLGSQNFSYDGKWVSYEINPQKGDGTLHLYNTESKFNKSFPRGYKAVFSPQSDYLVFRIQPQYDSLRTLRLKKTKESKLPKDTLAIYLFDKDTLITINGVKSFSIGEYGAPWIVYKTHKRKKAYEPEKKEEKSSWLDFLRKEKKEASTAKKEKKSSFTYVYNPVTDKEYEYYNIKKNYFAYNGSQLALLKETKDDSLNYASIILFDLNSADSTTIFSKRGTFSKFSFDREGSQLTFTFSADTAKKNKVYELYYSNLNDSNVYMAVDTTTKGMLKDYSPGKFASVYFSRDGRKVFFGTAPTPQQEAEDTLLDSEKYSVDVWNYKDGRLQTQQLKSLQRDLRKTYKAVYYPSTKQVVQLEDSLISNVRLVKRGNANMALGITQKPYEREMSWDGWFFDYYMINTINGERNLLLDKMSSTVSMSHTENYIAYYKPQDSSWYSLDLVTLKHTNLTTEMNVIFANEMHDVPALPDDYGFMGWSKDGRHFFVKDRYDIWKLDAKGENEAYNLTKGFGRIKKTRFNPVFVNYEQRYLDQYDTLYLGGFVEDGKQNGFFRFLFSEDYAPQPILMSNHYHHSLIKARHSNTFMWRRMSFSEYPELYIGKNDFELQTKLTETNPQQNDYLWGSVELTNWTAFDGTELSGLIYKPENFDPNKKYPMIVYFYERYSDNLHYHYIPKPSHSTVNFTEYTSNGYIVFVPDIVYTTGEPAASAYNCIMSGTRHMMKNAWVDSTRMGLQGQSWGGYQTAMLVTQTNLFAAAEAGAPVSNMTSAYGGIRWGAGISRAFQYEMGQSRIGSDLWENRELYIKNSPLFFADKVQTPLLIMHNDDDGAVPWYQGIEYFCALRRLDKQVWMLTYNKDGHNLMKWPNRVDLSIRMMQFFDHYLQGKAMPVWMDQGVPAVKKGKETGYDLIK